MDIVMCNRAAQLRTAGVDDTAADCMSGDTIHASHNNSLSSGLEEMFPNQGNIAGDRGEGPSGLPSSESSEPMICEVSNQLKDLIEVVKTLVSDQRQMRERVEGIGAEVYQLQRGDAWRASIRPHERSSSRQSEDAVDTEIRARDEQLLITQQELNREIEQLKQQEIAASRQGAKNARRMREALQKRADNAEKCVSQIRARQHSNEDLACAAEAYQQHRQALEGYQCISNTGLTADTHHISLMGIWGMSEVPEVQFSPQCETRGTSEVPQRHNSLLRELSMPPPITVQGNVEVCYILM